MNQPRVRKRLLAAALSFLVLVAVGVVLVVRYGERGRTSRLERCISEKRPEFEKSLNGVGLKLGEPELWLAHPAEEEFAMFPIEGEGAGSPKRFYRIHTGVENGAEFCRAGLVDSGGEPER